MKNLNVNVYNLRFIQFYLFNIFFIIYKVLKLLNRRNSNTLTDLLYTTRNISRRIYLELLKYTHIICLKHSFAYSYPELWKKLHLKINSVLFMMMLFKVAIILFKHWQLNKIKSCSLFRKNIILQYLGLVINRPC